MRYAIFDVESDDLLDKITTIHVIVVKDATSGVTTAFYDVQAAVDYLDTFDRVIGHNCIMFDIPAINRFVKWTPKAMPIDTMLISRLLWPDRNTHPAGGSSLKAWGKKLALPKGEFSDFSQLTKDMVTYCKQDVDITHRIFDEIMPLASKCPSAVTNELLTATIIAQQVANGFGFDSKAAAELQADLSMKQIECTEALQAAFPPKLIPLKTKVKEIPFNPGSRDMIASALIKKYKWKPTEFTDTGKPKIDEAVLATLHFPEIQLLSDYLLYDKRLGQLAQWIEYCRDGKIHGGVNTNGAISGRMTHSEPNMAQVPRGTSMYGPECRALFHPTREGWVQVGADAAGLELRMLAHYLAAYDGGAYGKIICDGDIHTHNQKAAGLANRDQAKTFIYGLLYGAGDAKVGSIVSGSAADGKRLKTAFKDQVPAYGKLLQHLDFKCASGNLLSGLDGRPLPVRSAHSALNLLLQSAGAVVMKRALVTLDDILSREIPGQYAFMANIHDEWQIECPPEHATLVGVTAVDAIKQAGVFYKLQCPLDGAYTVGTNWKETH